MLTWILSDASDVIFISQMMFLLLLWSFVKFRKEELPDTAGTKLMFTMLVLMALPSAIGSMRSDTEFGVWDVPWKGLRVPDVKVRFTYPDHGSQDSLIEDRSEYHNHKKR